MNYYASNTIALAFMGDAVYEAYIREKIFDEISNKRPDQMHKASVRYVKATAQCETIKKLLDEGFLTEEETALVKRARNHKVAHKAKNAGVVEYKWATAFEALLGWLYLSDQKERLYEIMEKSYEQG